MNWFAITVVLLATGIGVWASPSPGPQDTSGTSTHAAKDEGFEEFKKSLGAAAANLTDELLAAIYESRTRPIYIPPTEHDLSTAARKGNLTKVREIVDKGIDVNSLGGEALHFAAHNGHVEVVRYLLEAGANPNGTLEREEIYPLRAAASNNHLEVMDLLLEAGAAVIEDRYRDGILSPPAYRGHLDAVKKLLAAGADPNYNNANALINAAEKGHTEIIKVLIKAGANEYSGISRAVRAAASRGYIETLRYFLEVGVDKTILNSALGDAAASGQIAIVNLLLEQGGNPSHFGTLKGAARNGHIEVVRTLLDAGAEITYDEVFGFPLHFAASEGHLDVVALLVEAGGDINRQVTRDMWWGSDFPYRPGRPTTNYGNGWSVAHVVARFGYPQLNEIVKLGADISLQDAEGRTPLHVAAQYLKMSVVKELLKICPDVSVLNNEGETAESVARNAVLQEPDNTTTQLDTLMGAVREVYQDRLATAPNNERTLDLVTKEFSDFLNKANHTLNETLKGVDTSPVKIKKAFFYILEERDRSGLVEAFEAHHCNPSLTKDVRIDFGEQFLTKCQCIPGEGPVLTYTALEDADLCEPVPATTVETPTSVP